MENEKTAKKELPLATEVIRTLKKIIFVITISFVLIISAIVGSFVWYISLPVECTDTNTYDNISQNTDNSGNNVIGGDMVGNTDNR